VCTRACPPFGRMERWFFRHPRVREADQVRAKWTPVVCCPRPFSPLQWSRHAQACNTSEIEKSEKSGLALPAWRRFRREMAADKSTHSARARHCPFCFFLFLLPAAEQAPQAPCRSCRPRYAAPSITDGAAKARAASAPLGHNVRTGPRIIERIFETHKGVAPRPMNAPSRAARKSGAPTTIFAGGNAVAPSSPAVTNSAPHAPGQGMLELHWNW